MDCNALLKKCETSADVMKVMNAYFNANKIKDKYSTILQTSLKKQTDYKKSLQLAYNFLLNQEFPTKANDYTYARPKGSAIRGMECHSSRF